MTAVKSLSGAVLICTLVLTSADAAKKTAKPDEPMAQDTSLNNLKDAPKAPALPASRFASVTGDVLIASTNLVLRRVRPQIVQWGINYR